MGAKDEVFNYVMNTPQDTNPAVLRSLLNDIEEGGGGGDTNFKEFCEGTLTQIDSEDITYVRDSCFKDDLNLISINLPNAVEIGESSFQACKNVTSIDFSSLEEGGTSAFSGCTSLTSLEFPKLESISTAMFAGCENVETADFGVATEIQPSAFSLCSKLDTLILRSSTLCELLYGTTAAFGDTPFDESGTGGILYVPAALIESYQAVSGWSTILGYTNNQILAIEGSQYE